MLWRSLQILQDYVVSKMEESTSKGIQLSMLLLNILHMQKKMYLSTERKKLGMGILKWRKNCEMYFDEKI